jgi:glycine cleavage system aminomethyltransferase T
VPPEGGQIVVDGRPGGRVTSARWSDTVGHAIGMAWVPPQLAEDGAEIAIKVNGGIEKARVRLRPFFDPDGEHLRS